MRTLKTPEVGGPSSIDGDMPQVACVTDYLDRPHEQVCSLLEVAEGQLFSDEQSTLPTYQLGELTRVSRAAARLPIRRAGTTENVAELRVIAVRTGREAITELLLVAPVASWMSRAVRSSAARALLEAVAQQIEKTPSLEPKAQPLAS